MLRPMTLSIGEWDIRYHHENGGKRRVGGKKVLLRGTGVEERRLHSGITSK